LNTKHRSETYVKIQDMPPTMTQVLTDSQLQKEMELFSNQLRLLNS